MKGHRRMKYSIDVDQELLQEVKEATGLVTDSETIAFALETLVRLKTQEKIRVYRGKLEWTGNLSQMRNN